MKPLYLVLAKTPVAKRVLEDEGAVSPFGNDVYLSNFDPASLGRITHGQDWIPEDVETIQIFVPNVLNDLPLNQPKKEKLKDILGDMHREALWWSRSRKEE